MVPATVPTFLRAMASNGLQCAESLATSADNDTTNMRHSLSSQSHYFGPLLFQSLVGLPRSGFLGTELPLSYSLASSHFATFLRSFARKPLGILSRGHKLFDRLLIASRTSRLPDRKLVIAPTCSSSLICLSLQTFRNIGAPKLDAMLICSRVRPPPLRVRQWHWLARSARSR